MEEIIPFPVRMIPVPVLKSILKPLDHMRSILLKKFFHQRPGNERKHSISCSDDSISCFEINFEPLGTNDKRFVKEVF